MEEGYCYMTKNSRTLNAMQPPLTYQGSIKQWYTYIFWTHILMSLKFCVSNSVAQIISLKGYCK